MSRQTKNKVKTVPNQLNTQYQHFVFQSQNEGEVLTDDRHIKKLNIASPTFASDTATLTEAQTNAKEQLNCANKENINRISLCLRDMKINDNNANTITGTANKINVGQNQIQQIYKNQALAQKRQNQKLVQKCNSLMETNKILKQENQVLAEKFKICKKCIQQKFQQVCKFMQARNTSQSESNIDIYADLKVLKREYKGALQAVAQLSKQKQQFMKKLNQLQSIIISYTEKSEKKKMEKTQLTQKLKQIQRQNHDRVEQLKRKNQIRVKQLQQQIKEKDKIIKKQKEQHEKLKFLKEEIQKKRIEDIKNKQQLQINLKQKQNQTNKLMQQLQRSHQQYQKLHTKLQGNSKSSQSMEYQLNKCQEQLSSARLSFNSIQSQNTRLKNSNQRLQQEINRLRKQNQVLYSNFQNCKLEKGKLQSQVSKRLIIEQRQQKRIQQLLQQLDKQQKQFEEFKALYQQQMNKQSGRSYPDISKFKQYEEVIDKQNNLRMTQQIKLQKVEQKYNKIIEELNKQIQVLRRSKQSLQMNLDSQRQKIQKINMQLQQTYRKIEQFGSMQLDKEQGHFDFRDRQRYLRKDLYSSNFQIPFQLTKATKATPQLRMIRDILLAIIRPYQIDKFANRLPSMYTDKDTSLNPIQVIEEIKKMTQQVADLFDDRVREMSSLCQRIQNKQEVISKLLRFTPEQKKSCILQYLKAMQNFDTLEIEQVFKATKMLEQQANEWKKYYNELVERAAASEQQIFYLRKQLHKVKNGCNQTKMNNYQGRNYEINMRKYENYGVYRQRDRTQKHQKLHQRFDKHEYRKY